MPVFVSISENDKRLIFAILLLVVLVFVLIGYIGFIVTRIMKWQGKKMDTLVSDVVVTRTITKKMPFFNYARKKNWRLFFKQSWIAVIILLVGTLVLVIRDAAMRDFSYNVFDYKVTGFNTVLFLWDFSGVFQKQGGSLLLNWPVLINEPHLSADAWASYIFMSCMIVGGTWYLIAIQSLIARTIRMFQLSTSVFEKSLEGFNQNEQFKPSAPAQQENTTNDQQKS